MKPIKEKLSQSAIVKLIADNSDGTVTTSQVKKVLESQAEIAQACLMKGGSGIFSLPFIGVKLKMKLRPARKAGKAMSFGKEVMLQARKASTNVKAFALKKLKDAVNY